MKKQDIVTILFTFICGIVAGVYLFVVGFKPQVVEVTSGLVPPADVTQIITIEGYQYGGCERSGQCASFRVQNNGDYSYLETSVPTAQGPFGGALNRRDWQQVRSRLTVERLEQGAGAVTGNNCSSFVDGVDYRYVIQFQGDTYELDTCTTNLDRESELGVTLDWLWQYFISDIARQ